MKQIVLLILFLSIVSCEKTDPTIQFKVEVDPPLTTVATGANMVSVGALIGGAILNTSWVFFEDAQVSGGNLGSYSNGESDPFNLASGTIISVWTQVVNPSNPACHSITIDTYINGSLFDSNVLLMGYDGATGIPCSDGNSHIYKLTIP